MKNAIRWAWVLGMASGLITYWVDQSVALKWPGILMISCSMILAIMGMIEEIYPWLRPAHTETACQK